MLIKTLALSLAAFAVCATAQAQTRAIDNLTVAVQPQGSNGTSIGVSFVTGTSAYNLADVVFPQILGSSNTYSATETFSLYTNNPATNTPLAVVPVTFALDNNPALAFGSAGFGQTTAIPNAAMLLAPSTRYWLMLSNASSTTWDYIPSTTYNSALGFTIPTTNASIVNGTTYNLSAGPQQFVLDVNAVPEPSTYCLMAAAGLFFVLRRKRSAKVA